MKTLLQKSGIALALVVSCLAVFSGTAKAAVVPPIAPTPCDTLYYESLSARAWLEAQREIVQNQNLILKPDSVMEYTCFDMFLGNLANRATNLLSENSGFGGNASNMDNALQDVVARALIAYGVGNFGHGASGYNLLGGHDAGNAIYHKFQNISGPTLNYNCDIMDRVWQAAKCIDMGTHYTIGPGPAGGVTTDGFFTFQEYADVTSVANAYDKRHRPRGCHASDLSAYKAKWNANLIAAYITPPYTKDPVRTYIQEITASSCAGSPCTCEVAPIPTGVTVTRAIETPLSYEDKVCVQPGCRYNPPGGKINGSVHAEGCYAR